MDTISKVVNMESIAVSGSQVFLSSPNNLFSVSKPSYFPLTSLPTKPPKFVPLKASSTLTCDDEEINRTFKKLQPSPWTDQFHSVSIDVSEMDALRKEIDVLKPKVKKTLMSNQGVDSTKKRILMIYLLRSLGLEYHFKEEIDETLKEGFEKIEEMMAGEEDLYTVSIIFCVFRSYGHNISSDVFRRFKGIDGNFKESLKGDAKGILSLYEAGHLRTTKDYILDEALSFTSSHLESLDSCGTCPTHLAIRIRNALTLPQHCNMEIVATVEYISSYEQEKDHDKMLLKFAKISLKLVQLQYLHDLKIVTKWYKEQEFASKFPPFFRDKLVENYFYVLGVFFEPQQSRARIVCTQCFTLFEIIDDTFDRYASLSEAESLANSLERWAPDRDMDKQPGYLKLVLNFIFDTFEEFERVLRPEDVKATIEEFKTYAKAQRGFAKWVHTAHVPSFAEYMEVGVVEDAAYAAIACYFMCLGNLVTKEAYEWLKSRPKLVQSVTTKLRLLNDIYGFEDDMDRGCVQNAVYCYMKQYGVTKEEAVTALHKMAIDAAKEINEEFLTTRGVSRLVLNVAMDFSKMITLCYNGYEGFTNPEKKIKEYMTSILVDLIRL